jgi:hypothetical protein
MQMRLARCCGLDIHKRLVVACAITQPADGRARREMWSFGTMIADFLQLGDQLAEWGHHLRDNGEYGQLLAPPSGSCRRVGDAATGERAGDQGVPGRKRTQGCSVTGGPPAAWSSTGQLRAQPGPAGNVGAHSVSQ